MKWPLKRPRARMTTLATFLKAWREGDPEHAESTEKLIVIVWGPVMVVLPGERRAMW